MGKTSEKKPSIFPFMLVSASGVSEARIFISVKFDSLWKSFRLLKLLITIVTGFAHNTEYIIEVLWPLNLLVIWPVIALDKINCTGDFEYGFKYSIIFIGKWILCVLRGWAWMTWTRDYCIQYTQHATWNTQYDMRTPVACRKKPCFAESQWSLCLIHVAGGISVADPGKKIKINEWIN